MARAWQAGQGKIGCILWILALAIGTMAAVKMIPVRVKVGELTDYAAEQAKWAGGSEPDKIRTRIHNKARELDLPLEKDKIRVSKPGGKIRIGWEFAVPIDFPGYTYYWQFEMDREWDIFIF